MINRFSSGSERFEAAVEAVIEGDIEMLDALLAEDPTLATARSPREHRATLLHYVAANGVEDERQRTPPNAPEIARRLVQAGADPNSTAEFCGGGPGSTALVALVSSGHPYDAGVQEELVEVFCSAPEAMPDGLDGDGYPMATAFTFFYPGAAAALAGCGAAVENIAHAAGIGRLDLVLGFLRDGGSADGPLTLRSGHGPYRGCYDFRLDDPKAIVELALVYAGLGGHLEVVEFLHRRGVDLNGRPHSNETALHLAAFRDHMPVVRYLVENGADTTIRDGRWDTTSRFATT
jgi:AcrR family transcriptional regulator